MLGDREEVAEIGQVEAIDLHETIVSPPTTIGNSVEPRSSSACHLAAPPFDFLERTLLSVINRMGSAITALWSLASLQDLRIGRRCRTLRSHLWKMAAGR